MRFYKGGSKYFYALGIALALLILQVVLFTLHALIYPYVGIVMGIFGEARHGDINYYDFHNAYIIGGRYGISALIISAIIVLPFVVIVKRK